MIILSRKEGDIIIKTAINFRFQSGKYNSGPGFELEYRTKECDDAENEICGQGES